VSLTGGFLGPVSPGDRDRRRRRAENGIMQPKVLSSRLIQILTRNQRILSIYAFSHQMNAIAYDILQYRLPTDATAFPVELVSNAESNAVAFFISSIEHTLFLLIQVNTH
jgi:hypothetical protein